MTEDNKSTLFRRKSGWAVIALLMILFAAGGLQILG